MVLDNTTLENTFKHVNGATTDSLHPLNRPAVAHHSTSLLSKFIEAHKDTGKHRHEPVRIDGHSLTTAAIVSAARHTTLVRLDNTKRVKERVEKSRQVVVDKIASGASIYGLSTGFGGSDQPVMLGHALLQHQHIGILPVSEEPPPRLPLQDPNHATIMPESWVKAAILVRMNSLIRGHSGVRWELIEKMGELLCADVVPVVPLRGSISASGDLSPLSYIAGSLSQHLAGNESIQLFHGSRESGSGRKKGPSKAVLQAHSIEPIALVPKEQLGIVNGTAFSAAVAALAIDDAMHLALLAQICTAMGTEALSGTRGSYASFIHLTRAPTPDSKLAQLDEEEVTLEEDRYSLRQDRYPLRTAPQFLGPQIEDLLAALTAITQECNSTTDNPLIESETGIIHHGGNFQAMAITNAMEKTRLALHHIGKLLFSQSTELCNPAMNNGLPPSLAATDPSLNYHGKGIDIATASYVSELGYLATPVSTHIQSAEMHNQAVNSLALISARATVTSLDVLSMLIASYLYLLCQALDLRALRVELFTGIGAILQEELATSLGPFLVSEQLKDLSAKLFRIMGHAFDKSTVMDSADQMRQIAAATTPAIIQFCAGREGPAPTLATLSEFQSQFASRATALHESLRRDFLTGARGATPASALLGKTKGVYEYVRKCLGIRMHGGENYGKFVNGIGSDNVSIGQNISKIYEAIRDGQMQNVVISLVA
ncbi:hypothetical protein NLJ89_g1123 [Agrocybe chaxingu]|uniref:Phenylalanine ammonia-lyase n=1 Tax=Agrocybe chaxingu TaxID=84603 RepID=A0A9W8TFQ2_9AGAR|nr:hypothetical protein NLJ89_g1123 [Agrocybe chaxingu]